MTTYENSSGKPTLKFIHTDARDGVAQDSQANQVSVKSPTRSPLSSSFVSDDIAADTTHQLWMQEYHRSRHLRDPPDNAQLSRSALSSSFKKISPNLSDQSPIINTANAKLNTLSISSELSDEPTEFRMSVKRNKQDSLDGYRIYRGQTSLTAGSIKNHTDRRPSSPDSRKSVASDWNTLDTASNNHGRRVSPPSNCHQHKLSLTKYLGDDNDHFRYNPAHFHTMARGHHSLPFRSHVSPRPRPQSAALATGSPKVVHKTKLSKSKSSTKSERPLYEVTSKVPKSKQNQSPKASDTFSPRHGESFSFSPRQLGTIPRPSFKLDINAGPKSESQNNYCSTPKSILKNTNSAGANSFLSIQPLKADHDLIPELSDNIMGSRLMSSDFSLNDFILTPRKVKRPQPPAVSGCSSPTSHVTSASNRNATSPRRPMSAVASPSPSKYELNECSSVGRKSVTFNSYVSLMSGNRISTIRSLPVDV